MNGRALTRLLLVAALGSGTWGCATKPSSASHPAGASARATALMQVDADFAARAQAIGTAAAFREVLAPDAVSLTEASPPIQGQEAIYQALLKAGEHGLRWKPAAGEVAASGDLGYTWGHYEVPVRSTNGTSQVIRGKYLSVWRRDAHGAWKLAADIGNTEPGTP